MALTPTTEELRSAELLEAGRHDDPFGFLGAHSTGSGIRVRCFAPQAATVELVCSASGASTKMQRAEASHLFIADKADDTNGYRFRFTQHDSSVSEAEDPYRFPTSLGELDSYLIGEGSHYRLYEQFGAHCTSIEGVTGVRFSVWAPNAQRVSVVGPFNDWDGRRHPMRKHPSIGVWELFIPGLAPGALYKYELLDASGALLPLKADPFAFYCESAPGNASIVFTSEHDWQDGDWRSKSMASFGFDQPVSIYEVHIGSWRRKADDNNRCLNYRELADELIPYVLEMGFTHIELLPISEYPFGGSWGYQPVGLFASTSRYGSPDDLREFVDCCHRHGIGVIIDWVAAHFPTDPHGLARFDGTALYEHEDPRRGLHPDWDTLVFNYGRAEVLNYLLANALFWVREFHIDGLRIDAVASMLYLDYSRKDGEWLPNEYGGNENTEAIGFLRRLNALVHAEGGVTIAEESTAWPAVTKPVEHDGLGFSYKWNMGWMNDTLRYMAEDPVHRSHHHDRMTFSMVYAFSENFVLPLSHDEVVHGKRSIIGRMPGDDWQRHANLRAYYAFMFAHPGKKLLFMGDEFGQNDEWAHDRSLDWHLLAEPRHHGLQQLVRDLNRLYRELPALHEIDCEPAGFRWLNCDDRAQSVFSMARFDRQGNALVAVCNFTPVVRHDYRIGVPVAGDYREVLNTDAETYGGSGVGNDGLATATLESHDWLPATLTLSLPPLATVFLRAPNVHHH